MSDLPSRGRCHAAFLLAYSARVGRCDDIDTWLKAAADKPTHMATALDLVGTVHLLLDAGLARVEEEVVISGDLARLDKIADLTTLKAIAGLILMRRPPDWLRFAVSDGCLVEEFIPAVDLDSMSWMGADLEAIVVTAHHRLYGTVDDALLKRLGDAGELAVISALRNQGLQPRHVALVSDRFGYDVELDLDGRRCGLEVKTAVPSTAPRVLVSRNEFEVAQRMGDRWKVVQVIFSSKVMVRGIATADDVKEIRELSGASLIAMAPMEDHGFRWIKGAEFRPDVSLWVTSNLSVAPDFVCSVVE